MQSDQIQNASMFLDPSFLWCIAFSIITEYAYTEPIIDVLFFQGIKGQIQFFIKCAPVLLCFYLFQLK